MNLPRRITVPFWELWRRLRGRGSPLALGASVAAGLFIGCLPLYGLHLPLCLLVCLPLGLDAVAAYLAAQISNPWLAPFLLALEARVGASILGRGSLTLTELRLDRFGDIFERTFVGALVVGSVLAVAGGALTFVIARRSDRGPEAEAIRRTLERYRGQPRGDRFYVDLKLRTDPVVARLGALGALGRVIDAGAGRGQMGLFLWELGQVSELSGFDPDPRKVELASRAAGEDGRYEVAALAEYAPGAQAADSVLLLDVLHYLPPAEQDAALSRLRAWLKPGGRLLLRDIGGRSRLRSALTRCAERLATATGYNRASRPLDFRSLSEVVTRLEALGFVCEVEDASAGTPFDNALIVARLVATGSADVALSGRV
jgi:2-polyprenyl-6-hydroxyphenyl methylase/3-demethylubiquinone-9 3-methyltransferase